jgi:hypothetical protein
MNRMEFLFVLLVPFCGWFSLCLFVAGLVFGRFQLEFNGLDVALDVFLRGTEKALQADEASEDFRKRAARRDVKLGVVLAVAKQSVSADLFVKLSCAVVRFDT